MNRTNRYKFRGKRIDNGQWAYGSLDNSYNDSPIIIIGLSQYEVDPATVGQFIGLVDKDGKEIYEGDKVQDPYREAGVVTMINGSYKLVGSGKKLGFGSYAKQCQIVGNIHDTNPHLLTEK